jgi:hypothetical protein
MTLAAVAAPASATSEDKLASAEVPATAPDQHKSGLRRWQRVFLMLPFCFGPSALMSAALLAARESPALTRSACSPVPVVGHDLCNLVRPSFRHTNAHGSDQLNPLSRSLIPSLATPAISASVGLTPQEVLWVRPLDRSSCSLGAPNVCRSAFRSSARTR